MCGICTETSLKLDCQCGCGMRKPEQTPAGVFQTIVRLISAERKRQDDKWGVQDHNPFIWNTILGEEIGEIANAVLENEFSNGVGHNPDHIAVEIIQSIAVGVAWLECLDRHELISIDTLNLNA